MAQKSTSTTLPRYLSQSNGLPSSVLPLSSNGLPTSVNRRAAPSKRVTSLSNLGSPLAAKILAKSAYACAAKGDLLGLYSRFVANSIAVRRSFIVSLRPSSDFSTCFRIAACCSGRLPGDAVDAGLKQNFRFFGLLQRCLGLGILFQLQGFSAAA